ncbi:hypothetical protein WI23_00940 [Burkholderia oklahomensis C6786]|nr:hypothetical protein WI23_00940 [Burkholderia oklahomensis C6786]KUY54922.1 hypothetical protein WI23_21295 [Burkholderia oklahomensis C6786]
MIVGSLLNTVKLWRKSACIGCASRADSSLELAVVRFARAAQHERDVGLHLLPGGCDSSEGSGMTDTISAK